MGLGISLCVVALTLGMAGLIVERERSRRLSDGAVLELLKQSALPWCFLPLDDETYPIDESFESGRTPSFSKAGTCSEAFQMFIGNNVPSWAALTEAFQQPGASPFQDAVQCVLQYGEPVVCSLDLLGHPYTLHLNLLQENVSNFPIFKAHTPPFREGLLLTLEESSTSVRTQTECAQATQQARACLAVLNALSFPIWTRDKSGRLTFCNKAYAKELETHQHNVIAHQWELIDGPDARAAKDLHRKAFEEGTPQSLRVHKKIKGALKTFELMETPVPFPMEQFRDGWAQQRARQTPSPSGHPEADPALVLVGSAIDLSTPAAELKTAQDALALFQSVTREFDIPFCILDDKGRIIAYSAASLPSEVDEILREAPLLSDVLECLREHNQLPDYIDFGTIKQISHDWCTHKNLPYHDLWYLPSGRALDLLVRSCQDKTLIIAKDVSQSLDLERSYRVLRAVWDVSVEQAPDALLILSQDHRIQKCSRATKDVLGIDPLAWSGRSVKDLLEAIAKQEDLQAWKATLENAIELRKAHRTSAIIGGRLMECVYMPLPDGGHRLSIFPADREEEDKADGTHL